MESFVAWFSSVGILDFVVLFRKRVVPPHRCPTPQLVNQVVCNRIIFLSGVFYDLSFKLEVFLVQFIQKFGDVVEEHQKLELKRLTDMSARYIC